MCGISVIVRRQNETTISYDNLDLGNLHRRGPDSQGRTQLDMRDSTTMTLDGCVLHLRGELTCQPVTDSCENVFLWNGEIFNGLHVESKGNDTEVLCKVLQSCSTKQSIADVFSQIEGPWAFIYWQAECKRLWFGRDVFGRRSLLWHLPTHAEPVFILSSVRLKPQSFQEVPCHGIYYIEFSHPHPDTLHQVELIPWFHLSPSCIESSLSTLHPSTDIHLDTGTRLTHTMPPLSTTLPPPGHTILPLGTKHHLQYLTDLMEDNKEMNSLAERFLNVLEDAVNIRITNIPRSNISDIRMDNTQKQDIQNSEFHHCINVSSDSRCGSVTARCLKEHRHTHTSPTQDVLVDSEHSSHCFNNCCCVTGDETVVASVVQSCVSHVAQVNNPTDTVTHPASLPTQARVAVLFSGGLDSAVITALVHRCVPLEEPIDLLNVAFEQRPPQPHGRNVHTQSGNEDRFCVPDRIAGLHTLSDLPPMRKWNFVEINVTHSQLIKFREERVKDAVYPLNTVLDDSIGCALWCAARGCGVLSQDGRTLPYQSTAKVVLVGMGADEQLAGYSRHRTTFTNESWPGLVRDIHMELSRISARNLGRDDRIISDHGRESRYPFLDERVVSFLNRTDIHHKCDLGLPRGLGEKLLLRLVALKLGVRHASVLPKRAIQFGSRIAKLDNVREKASQVCDRLG